MSALTANKKLVFRAGGDMTSGALGDWGRKRLRKRMRILFFLLIYTAPSGPTAPHVAETTRHRRPVTPRMLSTWSSRRYTHTCR